jgi:hypothetical protein
MAAHQRAWKRAHPEVNRNWRRNNWETNPRLTWAKMAHHAARMRSRTNGTPFTIKVTDVLPLIVERCPVLGIALHYVRSTGKMHDNSPSIDRIKPELGYVPGNIVVVSLRANAIKRNATVEELEAVARFYRNVTSHS